jgi:hypothetical protein
VNWKKYKWNDLIESELSVESMTIHFLPELGEKLKVAYFKPSISMNCNTSKEKIFIFKVFSFDDIISRNK